MMDPFLNLGSPVTLLDAAARSLLMAAAVGAGLRLLRVNNVRARKAAWVLVLAGATVMPMVAPWAESQALLPIQSAVIPVRTWLDHVAARGQTSKSPVPAQTIREIAPPLPSLETEKADPAVSPEQAKSIVMLNGDHFPAPSISIDGASRATKDGPASISTMPALSAGQLALLAYLVISGTLLIRLAVGLVAAARLWAGAEAAMIDSDTPVGAGLRVRWSRGVSSPVTIGTGILLPASYSHWDSEKLRIVLAHESSHVRQRDFYLQLFAALYTAAFWFSPLGWWLKRTLCDLSEAISDGAAVGEAASHASYAQVLLEFAALPRTTRIGVAMARTGRLSHRIERLLDESRFRQAFAGGRGRALAAALLVPLAMFATTSLIRVEAAGQAPPTPPTAPAALAPPTPADLAAPAMPAPPSQAAIAGVPPAPAEPPSPDAAPAPPAPGEIGIGEGMGIGSSESYAIAASQSDSHSSSRHGTGSSTTHTGQHYSYSYSDDGESYALISGDDKHVQFTEWHNGSREELEKARQIAHGDFLCFTRNGKSYVIDDPAIVSELMAMYKPMEDLGRQQEELGRKQEELGREQEKIGERMNEASIPTPDVSKEMAALNAAMAELNAAKGKTVTQEQLAELQEKLADLQGRLGDLQGEVGAKQGEIGALQGELGAKQGALGAQQGHLGEEQGRIAGQADRKVKSVIDQSLKNGKARPVE